MRYLCYVGIGGLFLFSIYEGLLGLIPYLDYRYGLISKHELIFRLIKPTLLFVSGLALCWIMGKRLEERQSTPTRRS